jgi:hypothetical protein
MPNNRLDPESTLNRSIRQEAIDKYEKPKQMNRNQIPDEITLTIYQMKLKTVWVWIALLSGQIEAPQEAGPRRICCRPTEIGMQNWNKGKSLAISEIGFPFHRERERDRETERKEKKRKIVLLHRQNDSFAFLILEKLKFNLI